MQGGGVGDTASLLRQARLLLEDIQKRDFSRENAMAEDELEAAKKCKFFFGVCVYLGSVHSLCKLQIAIDTFIKKRPLSLRDLWLVSSLRRGCLFRCGYESI